MAGALKEKLDAVEDSVPRYLYRAYSNSSHGTNSLWSFKPGSPTYTDKLSDLERQHAKQMVKDHLLWKICRKDKFISWTDSLLWALQHAIRKDSLKETDVKICVLDTSKIDTRSFFAASDLLRIYEIADSGYLAHRYYIAEYLYYGELLIHGSSSTVPLNLLRKCGLFDLLPEMEDPKWRGLLCKAVEHFRNTMFSVPHPLTPNDCRTALQLASLTEKEFMMPVMVALLSLRCRDSEDLGFQTLVTDHAEPSRDFTSIIPQYKDASIYAPELATFRKLMDAAYVVTQKKRVKDIDPLSELGNFFETLSANFASMHTSPEGIPNTVLSPSVQSQFSSTSQAPTEIINAPEPKGTASPLGQPEQLNSKPFPARLPSRPHDRL